MSSIVRVCEQISWSDALTSDVILLQLVGNTSDMQGNQMNASQRLQNISNFCGQLYKRFAQKLSPSAIFRYEFNQLLNENTSQLLLYKEMIWKVSEHRVHGMESFIITEICGPILLTLLETTYNDNILMLTAGGKHLRDQAVSNLAGAGGATGSVRSTDVLCASLVLILTHSLSLSLLY